jgi:hypothetical protein
LRGRRDWRRAPAICSHQIFCACRALRTQADSRRTGFGPIWFCKDIRRLEKSAFVLILKNARCVLAAADGERGAANQRKTEESAVTQQTSHPK